MKKFEIRKLNGKTRLIYAPDEKAKRELRALVPQLNLLAEELDVYRVQHGFTEGRSPVTNAHVHIGFEWTVSFDMADWFDSVTKDHIRRSLGIPTCHANDITLLAQCSAAGTFQDGATRQGLPTSPALANIAAAPMDKEIWERFCTRKGRFDPPAVYSRYADDLTFSTNNRATVDLLLQEIPLIVQKHVFKINPAKTKVQCAKAGRRIITGVAVDGKTCYVPRDVRRRLRAGRHQLKVGMKKGLIRRLLSDRFKWKRRLPLHVRFVYQLSGLEEWAKLKAPKAAKERPQNVFVKTVKAVVKAVCASGPVSRAVGYFGRKLT